VTHFHIAHEFDADPDRYWAVFFDEDYNIEVARRLDMKERTVLFRSEDDATIRFEQKLIPRRDLPTIIKKLVGGDLGYVERATYHKGRSYMDVSIEPTLLKERTDVRATYTVTPIGPGRVRRTYEGDVHVDVPLVGRKIEAAVLEDVRRSFDIAAQVTKEWLDGPR
jgi:Protein of unknown function (DUF2505)